MSSRGKGSRVPASGRSHPFVGPKGTATSSMQHSSGKLQAGKNKVATSHVTARGRRPASIESGDDDDGDDVDESGAESAVDESAGEDEAGSDAGGDSAGLGSSGGEDEDTGDDEGAGGDNDDEDGVDDDEEDDAEDGAAAAPVPVVFDEPRGAAARLPWRASAYDFSRANFSDDLAGFVALEEIPSGGYDIIKGADGTVSIQIREEKGKGTAAAANKPVVAAAAAAAAKEPAAKAAKAVASDAALTGAKRKRPEAPVAAKSSDEEEDDEEEEEDEDYDDEDAEVDDHDDDQEDDFDDGVDSDELSDAAEEEAAAAASAAAGKKAAAKQSSAKPSATAAAPSGAPKSKSRLAAAPSTRSALPLEDVSEAWGGLGLTQPLLEHIALLGFEAPSRIQAAALPAALVQYKDIVATAETGSGKTLAYGLPLLQRLLERRDALGIGKRGDGADADSDASDGDSDSESDAPAPVAPAAKRARHGKGKGKSVAAAAAEKASKRPSAPAPAVVPVRRWRHLPALVLVPTRELAMQVTDHLNAVAKPLGMSAVAIVGGFSASKQERQLRARPDIVVATPGRLWDLASSGRHEHVSALHALQFLVLDEADRLCEKGHFAALHSILAALRPPAAADPRLVDPEAEAIIARKAKEAAAEAEAAAGAGKKAAPALQKEAGRKVSMDEDDEDDEDQEDGSDDDDDDDDGDDESEEAGDKDGDDDDGSSAPEGAAAEDGADDDAAAAAPSSSSSHLVDTPARFRRQTFLFSATLGMATAQSVRDAAKALLESRNAAANAAASAAAGGKDGKGGKDAGKAARRNAKASRRAFAKAMEEASRLSPLELLMARVGLLGKPAVIRVDRGAIAGAAADASGAEGAATDGAGVAAGATDAAAQPSSSSIALPPGLRLARLSCTSEDKDVQLYAFLLRYPGRVILFVNAISTLRRVVALLEALRLPVLSLHASMQQRQRIAQLERFRAASSAVLVATDIAARGLDVPDVPYVLHYAMPHAAESFVHRCGRTARASAAGLALALVAPDDQKSYARIMAVLGLDGGLPEFPLDDRFTRRLLTRVGIARRIAVEAGRLDKDAAEQHWLLRTASAAGVDIDADDAAAASSKKGAIATAAGSAGGIGATTSLVAALAGSKHQRKLASRKHRGNGEDGEDADADTLIASQLDKLAGGDAEDVLAAARHEAKVRRAELAGLRSQLDALLRESLLPSGASKRYITANPLLSQEAHPAQSLIRIEGAGAAAAAAVVAADGDSSSSSAGAAAAPKRGALVAPRVIFGAELSGPASGGAALVSGDRGRLGDAVSALARKGKRTALSRGATAKPKGPAALAKAAALAGKREKRPKNKFATRGRRGVGQ